MQNKIFEIEELKIDFETEEVYINNQMVHFSPLERKIFFNIAKQSQKNQWVYSEDLIRTCFERWGDLENPDSSLKVTISIIRKKMRQFSQNNKQWLAIRARRHGDFEIGTGYKITHSTNIYQKPRVQPLTIKEKEEIKNEKKLPLKEIAKKYNVTQTYVSRLQKNPLSINKKRKLKIVLNTLIYNPINKTAMEVVAKQFKIPVGKVIFLYNQFKDLDIQINQETASKLLENYFD